MKKILTFLTILLLSLGLVGCNSNSTTPDTGSNDSTDTDGGNTDGGNTDGGNTNHNAKLESYSYTFKNGDLNKEGGTTEALSGLKWTYGSSPYIKFDSVKGFQIGSSKNNVKEISFETTFPGEGIIKDFSIELSVAKSGNSNYIVSFGDYTKTDSFTNTTVEAKEQFDLNVKANSFKLTLKSEAMALYLKSISFSIEHEGDWGISADTDEITPNPGQPVEPGKNGVAATKFKLVSIEEYYKNTDLTLTKNALKAELNTLVSNMTGVSYGDSRYMLLYTDEDIKNPGKLNGIYEGTLFDPVWDSGSTWNREHVWACNRMQIPGEQERPDNSTIGHTSDLHNLRVSGPSINSSRGNKGFDNTTHGEFFFPNQNNGVDYRGDVARILFYMYIRYNSLNLDETVGNNTIGKLSVLIKWANEDKPDEFEKRRNNRIFEYQGNRNPFIDHPELVNQLFA